MGVRKMWKSRRGKGIHHPSTPSPTCTIKTFSKRDAKAATSPLAVRFTHWQTIILIWSRNPGIITTLTEKTDIKSSTFVLCEEGILWWFFGEYRDGGCYETIFVKHSFRHERGDLKEKHPYMIGICYKSYENHPKPKTTAVDYKKKKSNRTMRSCWGEHYISRIERIIPNRRQTTVNNLEYCDINPLPSGSEPDPT